ncbi:alanine--tRNA ligase [Candidatus Gracilibacteria bacterium CG2_30_37_12]|nr:MAG: alanine--tRNA ligase [Candidatus Gracilibacteria bacterium CG2_30_37_12]
MHITSTEIRSKYLEFFKSKGHAVIPSSSLVPENDPSVLFNTAGMQPLIPYLLGEKHPSGVRLADVQKCVRTGDIDDVGDDTHLTFFEMLGNWSLGDYFKSDSIAWSWEFLTDPKWLGLDPRLISVTVFEGDENAPLDEESIALWKSVWQKNGLDFGDERIARLPAEDNWWAAGATGPCGPDTEIFYYMGEGLPPEGSNKGTDSAMWMEIWNNVFMQYNRVDANTLDKLPAPCVDTGMGLERCTVTLNHMKSVYETDLFAPVLLQIKEIVGTENYVEKSARIVADHIRAATQMIADGVLPKNVDQGYILRRLIRRAIREFYKMGYEQPIIAEISKMYISQFEGIYDSVRVNKTKILEELTMEEGRFGKTLKDGIKEFEKLVRGFIIVFERTGQKVTTLSGEKAFRLYDTYGFPIEMTVELACEAGLEVDLKGFHEAFQKHQELSRTSSEGKFKGGLADSGTETTELHTATHLLLAGLRKVLGDHVHQAGSNITTERLRFDFTHGEKVTPEQLKAVEEYVNTAIQTGATMVMKEIPKEEARASGVVGSFWEKYPDVVKVYTLSGPDGTVFTRELCGGPHIETTTRMGIFKIQKEEASSAGVRRIKAVLVK